MAARVLLNLLSDLAGVGERQGWIDGQPHLCLETMAELTFPETDRENTIEQRFVADAGSFGGFREFLAVANVGIRVGLEKVRPSLGIEAEVHARIAAELKQTIKALGRFHQESLHLRRQVPRRADLDAATLLELEIPLCPSGRDPGRIGTQPPQF